MNYATDAGRMVIREFEAFTKSLIGTTGIWPLPLVVLTARGIDVRKMRVDDSKAYEIFLKACNHPEVQAAAFGLDRFEPEEEQQRQNHEFQDVLTCVLYERSSFISLEQIRIRDRFKFGAMYYHIQPRKVLPIDWTNRFWTNELQRELYQYVPDIVLGENGQVAMGPEMKRLEIPN